VLYNSTYIQPLKIAPKSNIWKLIYSLKPEAYGIPAPPPLPLSSYADKLDGIKPTTEENAGIN
jgi:hypothetical protein